MLFISSLKLFSILRYLKFCHDVFSQAGKQYDKKAKGNFKMYDIIDWEANNYNTQFRNYTK